MDDHRDLFSKIKNDPEENMEVMSELILDGNDIGGNEANELEIEPSELGILGSIMKSYDQLSLQSRIPGQVEFLLGDSEHSYIITVKRLDKTFVIDQTISQTDMKPNVVQKSVNKTMVNSKNDKLNDLRPDITKKNCRKVTQDNSKDENSFKSEISLPDVSKALKDKGDGEGNDTKSKCTQTTDNKTAEESLETPSIDISISHAELDCDKIIIEPEVDFKNYQITDNLDKSTSLENTNMLFEGDEKLVSDDDNEEEEDLNEISDIDLHDEINSDGSSDTEANNASLMDTLNDMLITNQIGHPDKLLYQCKICNVRTLKINQLNRHIRRKHRNKILPKEQLPDKIGGNEIIITDENIEDKNEGVKYVEIKKIGLSKNARKREKELQELLDLLNNGTKIEESFSNKNENIGNDVEDDEPNENHKCSFCDFTTNNQTALYRHIGLIHAHNPNEHYKKGKLRTDCVFCPFKGLNRKSLLLHLRTKHRGGKGYECGKCKYKTHHKSNFDRHVEVVHDKKRELKCDQCDFLTTRNYLLEKHIMYKHQGIMPYKCPEPGCDYGSTSSSTCRAHTMEVHKNIRPFVCSVGSCDFSTSRRFVLKSHMFREHGIGDPPSSGKTIGEDSKVMYQCPHCEHQASQRGNLQKHIRIKHLGQIKRFKCAECDFTASEKHFVKTHISEVHLGQFLYSCHLCKFKCSLRQRFQRHFSAVHLGQRPYHCESCDYKATQPVHLQRHIEVIHKGEKPHFCIYCKFNTAHRANLRAHLKSIHRVSEEHVKEVLLSCVDMRVMKRKGKDVQAPSVQEFEVKQEIIPVHDNMETMTDLSLEEDHQGTVVMVPGVVTVPQQAVDNVDDLEALEASLVLEKIAQHPSLTFTNAENVIIEGIEALQPTTLEHTQMAKVVKPLGTKVVTAQIQSPGTRRVFVSKPHTSKEIQFITNLKSVNTE